MGGSKNWTHKPRQRYLASSTGESHLRHPGPCVLSPQHINLSPHVLRFLTTLALWLRSSVVSVLNSLTTITENTFSFTGYLIFAALTSFELCLQLEDGDDLAFAVPACVVRGFPMRFSDFLPFAMLRYPCQLTGN